jgi:hypothetical protein
MFVNPDKIRAKHGITASQGQKQRACLNHLVQQLDNGISVKLLLPMLLQSLLVTKIAMDTTEITPPGQLKRC